jgi:hypothetical protein
MMDSAGSSLALFIPIQAGGGHPIDQNISSLKGYFENICSEFEIRGILADVSRLNNDDEFSFHSLLLPCVCSCISRTQSLSFAKAKSLSR